MDLSIAALAGKTIAILTPYVARTAADFVNTVGEAGQTRARALLERLRTRWQGEPVSAGLLERFEEDPAGYGKAVELALEKTMEEDPELLEEVSSAVSELGPTLEILQRLDRGEGVTGLESKELAGGRVTVTQEVKEGKDITGARIDRIG